MSELPSVSTLRTVGEHVELELGQDLASSPRYNDDIAPTKASQRTWSRWNVASLWVGMAICVLARSPVCPATAMPTFLEVIFPRVVSTPVTHPFSMMKPVTSQF